MIDSTLQLLTTPLWQQDPVSSFALVIFPHAVAAIAERPENISFSEKSEKSENKKLV